MKPDAGQCGCPLGEGGCPLDGGGCPLDVLWMRVGVLWMRPLDVANWIPLLLLDHSKGRSTGDVFHRFL